MSRLYDVTEPCSVQSRGIPPVDFWRSSTPFASLLANGLQSWGICFDPNSSIKLLIDLPRGHALHILESTDITGLRVVVVTSSPCVEYRDDLWELEPHVLLVSPTSEHAYIDAIERAAEGERHRHTPETCLTPTERRVLGHVARGWPNKEIAQRLGLGQQTVRNALTSTYSKFGLSSRMELSLYYWGMSHLMGCHAPSGEKTPAPSVLLLPRVGTFVPATQDISL